MHVFSNLLLFANNKAIEFVFCAGCSVCSDIPFASALLSISAGIEEHRVRYVKKHALNTYTMPHKVASFTSRPFTP